MYSRYIPQPDGSFRRNTVPESKPPVSRAAPPAAPRQKTDVAPSRSEPMGFLKQLLPRDFDSSDWIIVLLLLLMSGDKPEDRSHMLMTLALYLLM